MNKVQHTLSVLLYFLDSLSSSTEIRDMNFLWETLKVYENILALTY